MSKFDHVKLAILGAPPLDKVTHKLVVVFKVGSVLDLQLPKPTTYRWHENLARRRDGGTWNFGERCNDNDRRQQLMDLGEEMVMILLRWIDWLMVLMIRIWLYYN